MEIEKLGNETVKIAHKKTSLVYNPKDSESKKQSKATTSASAILLPLIEESNDPQTAQLVINSPGEYEVADVSIQGVAVKKGEAAQNIFRIVHDSAKIVCMLALPADTLDDKALEVLGTADILIISLASHNGETKPVEAAKIARLLEPRVIMPLGSEKGSEELEKFLGEVGAQAEETIAYKTKNMPAPGEPVQVILLG